MSMSKLWVSIYDMIDANKDCSDNDTDEDEDSNDYDDDSDDENDVPEAPPEAPPVEFAPGHTFSKMKELLLLSSMVRLKPFGIHKHSSMLLIREKISEKLGMSVPTDAIWKYVMSFWNAEEADKRENATLKIKTEPFDLPTDPEWTRLIEEQRKILNLNDKEKDGITENDDITATSSNVDIKTLKSVKVMVEKLDSQSLLVNCLKLNKEQNWEKTPKTEPNGLQPECSSSDKNVNVKRKHSDSIDLDTDKNLEENIDKNHSSDDKPVIKKLRSYSSDKSSSPSDVSKPKTPNFVRTSKSSNLEYSSNNKVKNIRSNNGIKKKHNLSQSLSSLNVSPSKKLSKFKIQNLKVSKDLKRNGNKISKPTINIKRKSYKLRAQSMSFRNISSPPDTPSRTLRSKTKSSL